MAMSNHMILSVLTLYTTVVHNRDITITFSQIVDADESGTTVESEDKKDAQPKKASYITVR